MKNKTSILIQVLCDADWIPMYLDLRLEYTVNQCIESYRKYLGGSR